jgi:hypothetical protein
MHDLFKIYSDLQKFDNFIKTQLKEKYKFGEINWDDAWQYVRPPFPIPQTIDHKSENMAPLVHDNLTELSLKILECYNIYNFYISLLKKFSETKEKIVRSANPLNVTSVTSECRVEMLLTGESLSDINDVRSSICSLSEMGNQASTTKLIIMELISILNDHYQHEIKISFKLPN